MKHSKTWDVWSKSIRSNSWHPPIPFDPLRGLYFNSHVANSERHIKAMFTHCCGIKKEYERKKKGIRDIHHYMVTDMFPKHFITQNRLWWRFVTILLRKKKRKKNSIWWKVTKANRQFSRLIEKWWNTDWVSMGLEMAPVKPCIPYFTPDKSARLQVRYTAQY